jgi:flagella basal body P-ring formation protein FlgA
MNRRIHLVRILLAALAASAFAADPVAPASWKLRPEVQVDSAGVFLDQLLTQSDPAVTDPHTRLADAPTPSQPSTLTRDQVLSLVRRQNPDFSGTITGADRVRISRRTRALGEAELLELLTSTLQQDTVRDRGELELRFGRPWTPVQIPDEPFLLKVTELPSLGVTPNFIARFELVGGRERLAEWQAVLQARVWREVLVARSTLKRGQALATSELGVERRDVLALREPLELGARADTSLELVEMIPPGSPLTARSVRTRPLVTRGRLVDAVLQDGALNITLKVEVLEDGQAGQMVRVRNPLSRRELSGKVMNEQTVQLPL